MPFSVWLGFPEGFLVSCYKIGMMLVESCKPDWGYVERLIEDFSRQLDDDASFLVEKIELKSWTQSLCEYCKWYYEASMDYGRHIEDFLYPPALCFHPERKEKKGSNRSVL